MRREQATATADFSTAAASAPPSVEMTFLVVGEREQTTTTATAKAAADFSTAAEKCAAFGRNDGVWVWAREHARREIIWNDE
jgi:hypothetical protein